MHRRMTSSTSLNAAFIPNEYDTATLSRDTPMSMYTCARTPHEVVCTGQVRDGGGATRGWTQNAACTMPGCTPWGDSAAARPERRCLRQ